MWIGKVTLIRKWYGLFVWSCVYWCRCRSAHSKIILIDTASFTVILPFPLFEVIALVARGPSWKSMAFLWWGHLSMAVHALLEHLKHSDATRRRRPLAPKRGMVFVCAISAAFHELLFDYHRRTPPSCTQKSWHWLRWLPIWSGFGCQKPVSVTNLFGVLLKTLDLQSLRWTYPLIWSLQMGVWPPSWSHPSGPKQGKDAPYRFGRLGRIDPAKQKMWLETKDVENWDKSLGVKRIYI